MGTVSIPIIRDWPIFEYRDRLKNTGVLFHIDTAVCPRRPHFMLHISVLALHFIRIVTSAIPSVSYPA
jgi:hypothetical protein